MCGSINNMIKQHKLLPVDVMKAKITRMFMKKSMNEDKGNSGGLADMSELMLSASMDWTVKLWYPKNEFKKDPIFTFESS